VRHHLDADVRLATDDGPRPWLCGVQGYLQANLAPMQAMHYGQSAKVDQCVPIVAEKDEWIV
jgi:hypothetical protein